MTEQMCRSPIISVLGHVDHGKSSILDRIRNSCIIDNEAGGITQAIGASKVPVEAIKKMCAALKVKMDFIVPGLLFIDTPGHEAFTSLRKRGGNLADIAILVVDINEGFKPQTIEAFEILRDYKTPFIIALNKIDLIDGFVVKNELVNGSLLDNLNAQSLEVQQKIETKLYEIVGYINEKWGLESERFDRCDFTKQIAIVPCSAKTGIGIPKLLMVITGLTQKYLDQKLLCNVEPDAAGKGTILEIKNVEGSGLCLDIVLYDGVIRQGDMLIIGGIGKPVISKVKGLFEAGEMSDMRDEKAKFKTTKKVVASTGVRISASDIEVAVAGMPIISIEQGSAKETIERYEAEVQQDVDEVIIERATEGVVVKADTLGSLEALTKLLQDKNIRIRKANIGNITRKDIADAESNFGKNPLETAILGFNVDAGNILSDKVKIITSNIIYKIIEEYESWRAASEKSLEQKDLLGIVKPCKIEYLHNYTFRVNNPAVIGIEVIAGELKPNTMIMKEDGTMIAVVKEIQMEKESKGLIKKKDQAAISLPGITVGRQINEGDIFLSAIPEDDFRKLKNLTKYLSREETSLLRDIAEIMRKKNPVWGV